MPLLFHPKPGSIVICDFRGFQQPEMIKKRPVIIVSPRHINRQTLCTVVPLSTTKPAQEKRFHFRFADNPIPGRLGPVWAKCDMLTTVGFHRLDRVKLGRGQFAVPDISNDELREIQKCLSFVLDLA